MRILDLDQAEDGEIAPEQFIAIDDPSQSYKITMAQLKKFLGIGENSILIPPGTDIYAYFSTAKSGQYYGENLTNVAQTGAWHAFDWTTHDESRGTLIEAADNGELAVHALAGGTWTKKKIISEAGGVIIGDSSPFRIKNKTQGKSLHILAQDADGTNKWYVGNGSDDYDLAISNYKAVGNGSSIIMYDDSVIRFLNSMGEFRLGADGAVSLSDYTYFDERYLRMPSAGGVGDVALVKLNNSDQFLHGSTVPGSSLSYAGLQTASDGFDTDVVVESKVLPGTWRITGTMVTDPSAYQMKVTTAIRIA